MTELKCSARQEKESPTPFVSACLRNIFETYDVDSEFRGIQLAVIEAVNDKKDDRTITTSENVLRIALMYRTRHICSMRRLYIVANINI